MTSVLVVAVLFAVLLALIWAGQRRLMYFPFGNVPSPREVHLERVEQVAFETDDGLTLDGWFLPASHQPAWFTVIVFNGNAGNRAYRAPLASALQAHNIAVLLFDYRGFGGNPGTPTEAGLTRDAQSARAYLRTRTDVDQSRVVYFGESLGTALAVTLAAADPPAAVILRSPFASMAEVGQLHYPMLPVRWLLRDRHAAIDAIGRVTSPVLVIAGERDSIVPLAQSRRLFDAVSSEKELIVVRGADHNDYALLAGPQMIEGIVRFLRGLQQR
ncbi:MAG: alpha/beta hydrolase [Vicinamibacterales bacterium]